MIKLISLIVVLAWNNLLVESQSQASYVQSFHQKWARFMAETITEEKGYVFSAMSVYLHYIQFYCIGSKDVGDNILKALQIPTESTDLDNLCRNYINLFKDDFVPERNMDYESIFYYDSSMAPDSKVATSGCFKNLREIDFKDSVQTKETINHDMKKRTWEKNDFISEELPVDSKVFIANKLTISSDIFKSYKELVGETMTFIDFRGNHQKISGMRQTDGIVKFGYSLENGKEIEVFRQSFDSDSAFIYMRYKTENTEKYFKSKEGEIDMRLFWKNMKNLDDFLVQVFAASSTLHTTRCLTIPNFSFSQVYDITQEVMADVPSLRYPGEVGTDLSGLKKLFSHEQLPPFIYSGHKSRCDEEFTLNYPFFFMFVTRKSRLPVFTGAVHSMNS